MLNRTNVLVFFLATAGCASSHAVRTPSSEDGAHGAKATTTFEECYRQLQSDKGPKECAAEPDGPRLARTAFQEIFSSKAAFDHAEYQLEQIIGSVNEPAKTKLHFEIVFRSKNYVKHDTEKMLALTLNSIRTELQMKPMPPDEYFRSAMKLLAHVN